MTQGGTASLDEFKARLPLADIVGRHVRLTRRGREHVGLCPFHQEKTPSFHVVEDKGFYHCFGCGQHGNAIDFVMAIEGLGFAEAIARLAELTGIPAPRSGGERQAAVDRGLLAANEAAARWFAGRLESAAGAEARAYLARRGVDEALCARFALGYAPAERTALKRALIAEGYDEARLVAAGLLVAPEDGGPAYDRFRHRVMFPIHDGRGRVVGFGGRALGQARAKYLNSPETELFHKGELLYGLTLARAAVREHGTVVVVEGYMDVIALTRAGFANAVAPLGTALGEAQLRQLWRLCDEPVICLDGDEAGLRAGRRLIERALPLLKPGKSLRFALMPGGLDPDDLLRARGREALARALAETRPLLDFLFESELRGRALDTPERRAACRQRLFDLAQAIADPTLRRLFREGIERRMTARFGDRWRRPRSQTSIIAPSSGGVGTARLAAAIGNPARAVERELLAPILAHPQLLHEIEEELEALQFSDPELEALRQHIVAWYGDVGHLDPGGLSAHLSKNAFAGLVEQRSARGTMPNWYAPEREVESVREGWRARVAQYRHLAGKRATRETVAAAIAGSGGTAVRAQLLAVDRLINQRDDRASAHDDPDDPSAPEHGDP